MLRARLATVTTMMLPVWGSGAGAAAAVTPATWNDFVSVDPLGGQYDDDLVQQLTDKVIYFFDEATPRIARYDIISSTLVEHRCASVATAKLSGLVWREEDKDILTNTMPVRGAAADREKMLIWWDLDRDICFNATPVIDAKAQTVNSIEISRDRRYLYYSLVSSVNNNTRSSKAEYFSTDLATGQNTKLYELVGSFPTWDPLPIGSAMIAGKRVLFLGIPSDNGEKILKLDVASGQTEMFKDTTTEGSADQVVYSEQGQRLIFSTYNGSYSVDANGVTTKLTNSREIRFSPDKSRFCRQGRISEIVDAASLEPLLQMSNGDDCESFTEGYQGEPDFSTFAYWRGGFFLFSRTLFFCQLAEQGCREMDVDTNQWNKEIDHYGVRPKTGVILTMDFEVRNNHLYAVIHRRGEDGAVMADLEYDTESDEVFRLNGTGSRLFLHHGSILKMLTIPAP